MPIKKDGTGKRWVEMEFLVPGSPEQVWQAIATGPGNAAWFTRAEIEEKVGGAIRFEFGPGMHSSGEVTEWQPPHRFSYVETEWSPGAPPVATEIAITSRSGGECLVRMVHSLFSSTDDWDDQMEGFEKGWPAFFEVLRIYLRHFAGQKGASFQAFAMPAMEDQLAGWRHMTEALGLAGANVGERRTTPAHPQSLSGTVERVLQDRTVRVITLGLDSPAPGIAMLGLFTGSKGIHASMCIFFYGEDAEAKLAESEPLWRAWFSETFPAPAPAQES